MFQMTVDDVFAIRGRGLVATGTIAGGTVRVGDTVRVDNAREFKVKAVEMFRKKLDEASAGQTVGLLLDGAEKEDVRGGSVLSGEGASGAGGVSVPGLGLT